MIVLDEKTKNIIRQNNRKFSALVLFSFLSVKNPESIKIKAPNAVTGSVVDHIIMPYYSHIKNRSFIFNGDKNKTETSEYSLIPKTTGEGNRLFPKILNHYQNIQSFVTAMKENHTHVGYIGNRADNDGNVFDEITLQIPMTDIERITLRTNSDRIIINAKIEVYTNNQNDVPVKTHSITENDKDFLLIDINEINVTQLKLIITKATPLKKIWLVSFYAGFEMIFDETKIIKIKHQQKKSENRDGSIGRLYFNTVTMELSNIDRMFDYENETSRIVKYLNSTATFSITLTMEHEDLSEPLNFELGTFSVTDFTTSLSTANVTIKGADFISSKKDARLNLGIIENKTAYDIFRAIALRLNLDPTGIDESLKNISYSLIPLNDTVAKVLNQLCSTTNVFCTARGNVFVATLLKSKHGIVRYPQRYFELDEYAENTNAKAQSIIPNVINLHYSSWEYVNGIFISKKIILMYNKDVIKQKLTPEIHNLSLDRYIDEIYLPETEKENSNIKPVSWQKTFLVSELPKNFHHIEITDPFIYRSFEYVIQNNYEDGTDNLKSVTVKLYNYENRNDNEQCTICFCVKEKPHSHIIESQNVTVQSHEGDYIRNEVLKTKPKNKNDINEIEERNAPNKPEVFSFETTGNVQVDRVEVGNYFVPGFFEYALERTPQGVKVKAWNYGAVPQVLSVNIYGVKLEAQSQKIVIQERNESNIRMNGEIVKDITVDGIANAESATEILRTAMKYYSQFLQEKSITPWLDMRIQLYDFLAFRKLRYASYMQGIVDEITLEYQGYITQKLTIKETQKHNRDSRVLERHNANDLTITDY